MKVVILGGGTSGTLCAWELRKNNKDCEIIIVEESDNTQYSPCAMPYVLSKNISKENIILLNEKDYESNNIKLLLKTKTQKIMPKQNKVLLTKNNEEQELNYDFLVLAQGSKPFNPGIKINTNNYSFFKTFNDLEKIINDIKNKQNITIIGAGFIGVEIALALKKKNVSLIDIKDQVLFEMLDNDMASLVEDYLLKQRINFFRKEIVKEVNDYEVITDNKKIITDYSIICTGVKPDVDLAVKAGFKVNKGIVSDEYQRTNFKNVFACGDCCEIENFLIKKNSISGLANTAYVQAKVVAKNILGMNEKIIKTVSASISKIGDVYIGSTGLTSVVANNSYNIISTKYSSYITSDYYSKEKKIVVKLICDNRGFILGAQFVSDENISGHINLLTLVIKNKINVQDLAKLETPYNPASNPMQDPIITTAKILVKKLLYTNKIKKI